MRIETPGFFDLQVNGFAGVDFNDPNCTDDLINRASSAMRLTGVTRYLVTLITSSYDRFRQCAALFARTDDPAIAGIHMEGPYISPQDGARGAHPREQVTSASIDDFRRRQEAADGRIVLVTLAPEVPGALELTAYLVRSNTRVAIGHTAANPTEIRAAISAGATLATHLGNGCAQMLPRHPNQIWEQLAADELFASLIVDGHHLPASTVKAMIRAKTAERTILVTDATAAAGCGPGRYMLGETEVELDETGRVAVPGAPNLAGSALTMSGAIEKTVLFTGLPLNQVLPMASTIPAHYLGMATAGMVVLDLDDESHRLTIEAVVG